MAKPDWAERLQRTFDRKYQQGVKDERTRVLNWVESNRRPIPITDEWTMYRDDFNSESLIAFINGGKND